MMRVVDFHHEVRDGELQLVHPQSLNLALRRKPDARSNTSLFLFFVVPVFSKNVASPTATPELVEGHRSPAR